RHGEPLPRGPPRQEGAEHPAADHDQIEFPGGEELQVALHRPGERVGVTGRGGEGPRIGTPRRNARRQPLWRDGVSGDPSADSARGCPWGGASRGRRGGPSAVAHPPQRPGTARRGRPRRIPCKRMLFAAGRVDGSPGVPRLQGVARARCFGTRESRPRGRAPELRGRKPMLRRITLLTGLLCALLLLATLVLRSGRSEAAHAAGTAGWTDPPGASGTLTILHFAGSPGEGRPLRQRTEF